jgi:hypothetical protein
MCFVMNVEPVASEPDRLAPLAKEAGSARFLGNPLEFTF